MYDEKDLKTILARAVEIQNRTNGYSSSFGSDEQLSLEEIEEIARDSGLSPEYVRQAAVELEGVSIEEPFYLNTGNNNEIELLGFATGKLDQKVWAEMRSIIEQEFGSFGIVKRRASKISWSAKPTGLFKFFKTSRSPLVEVKASDYKSTIRIKKTLKSYNKLYYPAFAALTGSVILFTIMLQTGEVSILFAIAGLSGLSRLFFKSANNLKLRSQEKLKETMAQLQTIITRRYTASSDNAPDEPLLTEKEEGNIRKNKVDAAARQSLQ